MITSKESHLFTGSPPETSMGTAQGPSHTQHEAEVGCYTSCGLQEVAPSPQHVPSTLFPALETPPRVQRPKRKEEVSEERRGGGQGPKGWLGCKSQDGRVGVVLAPV